MLYIKRVGIIVCLTFLFCVFSKNIFAQQNNSRPLDVVFCLDLSGSTNGLLNDIRDHLWMIVNQINQLNPKPNLRIGIVGFSRPSFGKGNAYVKVLSDITSNIDHVATELNRLKPSIEKGDQIVSAAINSCNNLNWTNNKQALKVIFLVGNGMVSPNGYEYVKSCEQAKENDILINTIYVMKSANWFKEIPGWRRIASITGGMQLEMTVNKPDNLTTWNNDLKLLDVYNKQFNSTLMWTGNDRDICKRELISSDSGAYEAGMASFSDRLFYKRTFAFNESLKNCDLIYRNIFYPDNRKNIQATDSISSFEESVSRNTSLRLAYITQMDSLINEKPIIELSEKYNNGLVNEENMFHRIIINVLIRQWKQY